MVALIKTRNFEQAIEAIKGKEKSYSYEHAYILHRLGKNKEALNILKQSSDKSDLSY